jgi:hypothetical protein
MGTVAENTTRTAIRRLNDQWRCHGLGRGSIMVTAGIQSEGLAFVDTVFTAVRTFNDFTPDNDPHGEHEFGSFTVGSERLFWKIDYYDVTLEAGSPDPADGTVTHRVLTIMLASEY